MTRRTGWRSVRRGLVGAIVAVAAIVALPVLGSLGATEANWSDSEYARVTPRAGTLGNLTKVGCTWNASAATVTWTNPTVSGTTVAPTTWTVAVTTDGNAVAAPSPGPSSTSVSFTASQYGTLLGLGTRTFTYTITGSVGAWTTTSISGTFSVNSTLILSNVTGCT